MNEEFLQYIWKYTLYDPASLKTVTGEEVTVLKPGEHNSNAGPDFLNARLKIGDTDWAGDVEIHINSSDWDKHQHQNNKAYNSVILQAVYHHDRQCMLQDTSLLPTMELKFELRLYEHYQHLINSKRWIPCKDEIRHIEQFIFYYQLESLAVERLQDKSESILHTLSQTRNDWAETFYIHLARNFGFKVNADPFEMLARSLPLKYIAKHKDNLLQVEALLFGQAGFLDEDIQDEYYLLLSREYNVLQSKFQLKSLDRHIWKFLRLRPDNFPTVRLSQFAALLQQSSLLFAKITDSVNIKQLQKFFNLSASEYWQTHYQFGATSANRRKKVFGTASFNNLVINTIVPIIFVYGNENGIEEMKDRAVSFLLKTAPEDNVITRNWANLGFYPKNAFETQGMIQLKNKYCDKKRCLYCQVGNKIISALKPNYPLV